MAQNHHGKDYYRVVLIVKEHSWVKHLTSLPKKEMGQVLVHLTTKKAPMLQPLNALKFTEMSDEQ